MGKFQEFLEGLGYPSRGARPRAVLDEGNLGNVQGPQPYPVGTYGFLPHWQLETAPRNTRLWSPMTPGISHHLQLNQYGDASGLQGGGVGSFSYYPVPAGTISVDAAGNYQHTKFYPPGEVPTDA